LIVLRMDTPGGLDLSIDAPSSGLLASPVPVATYRDARPVRVLPAPDTYILYATTLPPWRGDQLGAGHAGEPGTGGHARSQNRSLAPRPGRRARVVVEGEQT